jgi:hypothetical protein
MENCPIRCTRGSSWLFFCASSTSRMWWGNLFPVLNDWHFLRRLRKWVGKIVSTSPVDYRDILVHDSCPLSDKIQTFFVRLYCSTSTLDLLEYSSIYIYINDESRDWWLFVYCYCNFRINSNFQASLYNFKTSFANLTNLNRLHLWHKSR